MLVCGLYRARMSYPASLRIDAPERIANWRPLVHWLLLVPHYVVLAVLGAVSWAVLILSWVVILVTGRLPAGLAGLQAMYLRYYTVVATFFDFLTDQYPPFDFDTSLADPGRSQTSVSFSPALVGRNRITVLLRIVTGIPAYIFSAVVFAVANVCLLLGLFAVLLTGRWPAGLRRLVVGTHLVTLRCGAYGLLLTDHYPPFSID